MAEETREILFVALGANRGRSFKYRDFVFVKGVATVTLTREQFQPVSRYLEACCYAFPEGHPQLDAERGPVLPGAPAGQHPERTPQEQEHAVSLSEERPGEPAAEVAARVAADLPGPAGPSSPGEGSGASGPDGQPDSADPVAIRVKAALLKLDPWEDDHWTKDGRPALAAIEHLAQTARVTRAEVDAVLPGFNRSDAAAAHPKPSKKK